MFDGTNFEQEAGDYLLSLRNLDNHYIEFQPNQADLICYSLSASLLKGKYKTVEDSGVNLSRLMPGISTNHEWVGRLKTSNSYSEMHGAWPGAHNDKNSHYPIHSPFDKEIHPLRRTNVVTGLPAWEQALRNFYLSNDDSPSIAEKLMGLEDAHETYHLKNGNPVYTGLKNIDGDWKTPFIGSSKGHESHGKHQHSIRIRDFERWKEEKGHDIIEEMLKDGLTESDLQHLHFDERMEKLAGEDYAVETIDPTKTMSEEDIQQMIVEDPALLEEYTKKHSHSMGWLTWNLGLEFLTPEERTAVIEHISEHGTDDTSHQSIKLSDGHRISMSRIKKNMEMRLGAEFEHWHRSPHIHGANEPKYIESEDDTDRMISSGHASKALKETSIDGKTNVFDSLIDTITELTSDKENDDHIENLFPFSDIDINRMKKLILGGKPLSEVIGSESKKKHSHSLLSKEGLLNLVGYDKNLNALENHALFDKYDEPLIDRDTMRKVLGKMDVYSGIAKDGKLISNTYGPIRTGLNGADISELSAEEKNHWHNEDGKLRGWGDIFHLPFASMGGFGRAGETYREFIHHILSVDDGKTSLMGGIDDNGILNQMDDTVGLFGGLHFNTLPSNVRAPSSVSEILSRYDISNSSKYRDIKTRNRLNNVDDTSSAFSPAISKRVNKLNDKKKGWNDDFIVEKLIRPQFDTKGLFHSNPFLNVGSSITGDVGLQKNASMHHRLATSLQRVAPPHNPSQNLLLTYQNMKTASPEQLSSRGLSREDFLTFMGDEIRQQKEYLETISPDVKDKPEYVYDLESESWRPAKEQIESYTTPEERVRFHAPQSDDEFDYNELYQDLLDLDEQIEELENTPPERQGKNHKLQLARARVELERLQKIESQQTQSQLERGRRTADYLDFEDKKRGDLTAIADYARENLLPLLLEKDPHAFNTDNPNVAFANALRLFSDANRGLLLDSGHNHKTLGYNIDEVKVKSQQEKMGGESPHKNLASMLSPSKKTGKSLGGVELHPTMDVTKALKLLGLPNDEVHKKHVSNILSKFSGPFMAASLGQVATMGAKLNPKNAEMFDSLSGKESIYDHMDELRREVNLPQTKAKGDYRKAVNEFNSSNPAYSALRWLNFLPRVSQEEMGTFGLEYHKPENELFSSPNKKGLDSHLAKWKDVAGHIFTFDNALFEGDLSEQKAESMTKERMHFGAMPIKPLRDMDGSTVFDGYINGVMDWGYAGWQPTIGVDFDSTGSPIVGQNMPTDALYHSVQQPMLERVFGTNWVNQVLGNVNTNEVSSVNNQTAVNEEAFGTAPSEDPNRVAKSKIPREVPLIEPLHRIFTIDDLKQLRGFTGEWVISHYQDGKRVKVKRKGSRVDITDDDNEKIFTSDSVRTALRKVCEKDYVIVGVLNEEDLYIQDILLYEDTDVSDLTTRERVKLLRGQFDSYETVNVPSPSDIRITDEVGLIESVKELGKTSDKLLLRDAKSTYMKGEERHPKWVLLAKGDISIHVPFAMEMIDNSFIIHLPEDVVKYEIVNGEPVNPKSILGDISSSDYSLRLAKSLEEHWRLVYDELLKEELEVKDEDEIEPEIDEEEESAGILKPSDDSRLLKPEMVKMLLKIESSLDRLAKNKSTWTGARGLGIDLGSDTASPRGPTELTNESALPDWDMKKRPTEDPERAEDYPGREKKIASQYNDFDDKNLEE